MLLELVMLLWVFLTEFFITIQLLKSLRTKITTLVELHQHKAILQPLFVDDPDAVFLMDADAAFVRADLFKNYSVSNATGVTQTGISSVQLYVSASGTAGTFVVQAIDITQDPENQDTTVSNANILVRINNHFYRSGTGL